MDLIPLISIILEALIAILALVGAFKGRWYLAGFTITFGIYVYYDLARLYEWTVSESLLSVVFLIATFTALGAMIGLLKK